MDEKLTIKDIAKALNTTAATVSRALRDHPRISYETKTRVLEYAGLHNFKLNKIASSLRSGQTQVVGVIIPSAEINFFGSVVHGIESMANMEGYTVLIYQTNEKKDCEIKGLETFLSARVDGILVSLAKDTIDFEHFSNIKKMGIPIAFFDRYHDQLGISSVVIDDFKGAYLATQHLIDNGYSNIAHISGPLNIKIFNDRLNGYKQALKDYGLKFIPRMLHSGDISIEAGREGVKNLLKKNKEVDAIFAVEDFTALGVLKELKEMAIKVPEEIGVIGFANEKFDEHLTPSLSSIDQQTVKMGQEAFKLLLEQINKKRANESYEVKNIVLEPLPFFRESSSKRT